MANGFISEFVTNIVDRAMRTLICDIQALVIETSADLAFLDQVLQLDI